MTPATSTDDLVTKPPAAMNEILAVEFNRHGRLVYATAGAIPDVSVGERVVVPTDDCPEVATVRIGLTPVEQSALDGELDLTHLPALLRRATPADEERDAAHRRLRAEAELVAGELVERHQLPMRILGSDVLDCDPSADRVVALYFTAPGRVDFRLLVSDLARALRTRIDLRQIGSREAAAAIGGVGHCGLSLCCATFEPVFEPVTQRMARVQSLPSNPLQLQGACGRLLCCLAYENASYLEFMRTSPGIGTRVLTPAGPGLVVGASVPLDMVIVRHESGVRQAHLVGTVVPLRQKASSVPGGSPPTLTQ